MEQITTKAKKWGNSFGIILPKGIVRSQKIKEGVEIEITLRTKNKMTVGELRAFSKQIGLNKKVNSNTEKIMRETDKELWEI